MKMKDKTVQNPKKVNIVSKKSAKDAVKVAEKNTGQAVKNSVKTVGKAKAEIPAIVKPYELKKDEIYMSVDQLKHFEGLLKLWKQELMQEVDRTIYDLKDITPYSDPVDRASQEEEFNVKLRERDRERKLLKKIDEALVSIKSGDYGYCDECGSEIGIRRLEARPTATQCIECKTVAEIREKQIGG